jgi:hypothetical protein
MPGADYKAENWGQSGLAIVQSGAAERTETRDGSPPEIFLYFVNSGLNKEFWPRRASEPRQDAATLLFSFLIRKHATGRRRAPEDPKNLPQMRRYLRAADEERMRQELEINNAHLATES